MSQTTDKGSLSPRELLVFDSSALISYISNLQPMIEPRQQSDYAMQQRYLDLWHNKMGMGSQFDVAIPDHILYEVTGLLPISYKYMKQQCAALVKQIADSDGPEREAAAQRLQQVIDMHVEASPRLFVRPNKHNSEGKMLSVSHDRYSSDTRRIMANQLRFLLTFAAYHPEAIRDTKVGEDFCRKLKAEYSTTRPLVASEVQDAINRRRQKQVHDGDWIGSYTPSYGDLQAALGNSFTCNDMRFHATQAYLLGFRSESDFKHVLSRPDSASPDDNPRFVAVNQFVGKRLDGEAYVDAARSICPEELKPVVKASFDRLTAGMDRPKIKDMLEQRLTIGYMRKLLQPTERAAATLPVLMGERAKSDQTRTMDLDTALAPTKLLMEQYLFGGVIPGRDIKDSLSGIGKLKDISSQETFEKALKRAGKGAEFNERISRLQVAGKTLDDVAAALGYDVSSWQTSADVIAQNQVRIKGLHRQGFFERMITVDDLLVVQQTLADKSIAAPALERLLGTEQSAGQAIGGLAQHLAQRWKTVNKETVRTNGKPSEMAPDSGTPLEKMFTEALISGTITPREYFDIVATAQGLPLSTNSITSKHFSVTISRISDPSPHDHSSDPQPEHFRIQFADRFNVRGGEKTLAPKVLNELGQIAKPQVANVAGVEKRFYTMDLDRFIELARKHRYQPEDGKLSRVLEAPFMKIHYFASQLEDKDTTRRGHAAAILQSAVDVLGDHGKDTTKGEARLVQLQKDFESFHERFYTAEPNAVRPTNSIFAASQRNHRIYRRNLGEISLMEVGTQAAQQGTSVWLISNDGDIQYQTGNKSHGEGAQLRQRVLQNHSCFQGVASLSDDPDQAQRLQLVPTDQWLNTLVGASHHRKAGEWTGNKQPFNRRWEDDVAKSDPPRIQQI